MMRTIVLTALLFSCSSEDETMYVETSDVWFSDGMVQLHGEFNSKIRNDTFGFQVSQDSLEIVNSELILSAFNSGDYMFLGLSISDQGVVRAEETYYYRAIVRIHDQYFRGDIRKFSTY